MPYRITEPVDVEQLQQVLDALEAEIAAREQAAAELAIANAELQRELQRRLAESESFGRVVASLLQKTVLEDILGIVCEEAKDLLGATGSAILLLTDEAWLEVKRRAGEPLSAVARLPVDGSLAGLVVRQGEPVLVNDPAPLGEVQVFQWPADLKALLAVPLHVNGGVIGVLDVVNKPGGFSAEDVRLMSVLANQAAMAIEHARLQRQAEQVAVLEERQRLARELHDSVTQSMYGVALYADAASLALAAGKYQAAARHLGELHETAQQGMREMRRLIFQLHPPELETEGLATVLQARLAGVEARAGLQVDLSVEGERRLPIAIEADLYWIAQEALNNVLKHAQAEKAVVHLLFAPESVILEVRDDGVGIDSGKIPSGRHGGVGLRSIAERAELMGGKLTLESRPGEGTLLRVEVPL